MAKVAGGERTFKFGLAATIVTIVLVVDAAAIAVVLSNSAPQQAKIGDIIQSPSYYAGRVVVIDGSYGGWVYGGDVAVADQGPPVTRSDWCVYDNTGAIYVQAGGGAEILESSYPGTLSPTDENCIGAHIVVKGTVRISDEGVPYIG